METSGHLFNFPGNFPSVLFFAIPARSVEHFYVYTIVTFLLILMFRGIFVHAVKKKLRLTSGADSFSSSSFTMPLELVPLLTGEPTESVPFCSDALGFCCSSSIFIRSFFKSSYCRSTIFWNVSSSTAGLQCYQTPTNNHPECITPSDPQPFSAPPGTARCSRQTSASSTRTSPRSAAAPPRASSGAS